MFYGDFNTLNIWIYNAINLYSISFAEMIHLIRVGYIISNDREMSSHNFITIQFSNYWVC